MPKLIDKNVDFFKTWSRDMAYVLGFFVADGSMYINTRGSRYVAFYSNDKEIIEKIAFAIDSKNKISHRKSSNLEWNDRYVLQIGSKEMYEDLLRLGMRSNKSKSIGFPDIPDKYLGDFVRGYFDGDGNVLSKKYFRKDRKVYKHYLATKFISGSKQFLAGLRQRLLDCTEMGAGSFFKGSRSYVLSYAMDDSKRLFRFMYGGLEKNLYLARKRSIFHTQIDNTER